MKLSTLFFAWTIIICGMLASNAMANDSKGLGIESITPLPMGTDCMFKHERERVSSKWGFKAIYQSNDGDIVIWQQQKTGNIIITSELLTSSCAIATGKSKLKKGMSL